MHYLTPGALKEAINVRPSVRQSDVFHRQVHKPQRRSGKPAWRETVRKGAKDGLRRAIRFLFIVL